MTQSNLFEEGDSEDVLPNTPAPADQDRIQGELSERDEDLGDDDPEDEIELFSFAESDRLVVERCRSALRGLLARPDLEPRSIRNIATVLQAVERLPLPTPEFYGRITTKSNFGNSSVSRTIDISEDTFRLEVLEMYSSDSMGSDWHSSIQYEVGVGWRDSADVYGALEWLDQFSQSSEVGTDVDEDAPLIWSCEGADVAWDRLLTDL